MSVVSEPSSIQDEVADLIVTTLNLDLGKDEIVPQEPLFGDDGLGLDSIDALELALVISQKYGIEIRADDEENQKIFESLAALSRFIECNRKP